MRKNCFKTVAMVCLCVYRVPPPPGVHSTVTRYCNTPLECWNSQLQERELYSREVLNIWCHERVKECRDNDEKGMVGLSHKSLGILGCLALANVVKMRREKVE